MKKIISILCIALIIFTTVLNSYAMENEQYDYTAVLYNPITYEKIEAVEVGCVSVSRNGIYIELDGKDSYYASAANMKYEKIDNETVELYVSNVKGSNTSIVKSGDFIVGECLLKNTSPSQKGEAQSGEFGFIISVNSKIDADTIFKELISNELIAKAIENNKYQLEKEPFITTSNEAKSSTLSINATWSGRTAEATAEYFFIGGDRYVVDSIEYYLSFTYNPLYNSYVNLWYDKWDSTPLWDGSAQNTITTEHVGETVTTGSCMMAEVSSLGFYKVRNIPIPFFVKVFEIEYF